jgi:hypothetical protein
MLLGIEHVAASQVAANALKILTRLTTSSRIALSGRQSVGGKTVSALAFRSSASGGGVIGRRARELRRHRRKDEIASADRGALLSLLLGRPSAPGADRHEPSFFGGVHRGREILATGGACAPLCDGLPPRLKNLPATRNCSG